jgi:hypothetical protein
LARLAGRSTRVTFATRVLAKSSGNNRSSSVLYYEYVTRIVINSCSIFNMKTAITQHTNIMGGLPSIETSVQQLTIWESDYE